MIKKFKSFDEVSDLTSEDIFKPKVAVIGVGGAGTNAVNNMIEMGLSGVKFIVVNTDSQSLEKSISPNKLQIGPKITKGLGAGSKPEIGIQAAEESVSDITELLEDTNLLFVTCGMGGGTGTGASQVIAKIAKDLNILTIAFVTKPFTFEGTQRMDTALLGVAELEKCTDALVVIANQNLFNVIDEKTTMLDAFKVADNILYSGVKGITDLIVSNGVVNLDFNDIRSVMESMGRTMIASAETSGENRAEAAAKQAINNPLLDKGSLTGARKALINITGGLDMTLFEVDTIVTYIKGELDTDAFISFGTIYDESMNEQIRVSVVATGLGNEKGADIFTTAHNIAYDKNKMKRRIMQHQPTPLKKTENNLNHNNVMDLNQNVEFEVDDGEELAPTEVQLASKAVKVAAYNEEPLNLSKKMQINTQQFENPKPFHDDSFNKDKEMEEYTDYEDDESEEENGEIYPDTEDKSTNLFNLITKKSNSNVNKDTDVVEGKMKKQHSKQNHQDNNKDEESFFDIPSFLRKRS
ncbi:Cell division protein FtsZ [Candidatus Hepatincola sp. Pdp]